MEADASKLQTEAGVVERSVSPSAPDSVPDKRVKSCRRRSNYFLPGDVVWVRPAGLPYWPAEVLTSEEEANRIRARLISPPAVEVLKKNLAEETRKDAQLHRRRAAQTLKKSQKRHAEQTASSDEAVASLSTVVPPSAANREATSGEPNVAEETKCGTAPSPSPKADAVTASGQVVFFFDKLTTPEEVEDCIEGRLQRKKHDVSAYEAAFARAVLQANRLVRVPFDPNRLQPYQVCAVGIVHSLMRTHISAPRQPNTGTFEPQTAVIHLRKGLENAARDLMGFEYIWVLFQFSFAAPNATGAGQESLRLIGADSDKSESSPAERRQTEGSDGLGVSDEAEKMESSTDGVFGSVVAESIGDPLSTWRKRQGFSRSAGFKAMIIPPRDDQWRGVFATRSPHRPNFIGLSCVRLVMVHGLEIHIADHDLLHGTPVLDIKPYLPFCDAHPTARAGWVDDLEATGKGKGDHKYDRQLTLVNRTVP